MAIGADEGALLHFLSVSSDRFAARDAEREGLRRWVDVMKVEIDDATVIAAHGAAASSFLDQHALDLLESASHGLPDAPLAPPAASSFAAGVQRELGEPVPCTRV